MRTAQQQVFVGWRQFWAASTILPKNVQPALPSSRLSCYVFCICLFSWVGRSASTPLNEAQNFTHGYNFIQMFNWKGKDENRCHIVFQLYDNCVSIIWQLYFNCITTVFVSIRNWGEPLPRWQQITPVEFAHINRSPFKVGIVLEIWMTNHT